MSAAWVAGSVRASAMTRRRLGRAAARALAGSPSLDDAVMRLADSPYGHDVRVGQSLAVAQRAVVAAVVWNLRVLAGWQPRDGVMVLRALLAAVEAANVTDHLQRLAGTSTPAPIPLGGLATAWPRLGATSSMSELRDVLSTSAWGRPEGASPRDIVIMMRLALADRVMGTVPAARAWAAGSVALLLAREVLAERRALSPAAVLVASRVVGPAAVEASSLTDLARLLPGDARWALADVQDVTALWQAESRWWGRVERDGVSLIRRATPGPHVLVGAVAMMAVDAWRVRAALELAARGGGPLEVFDAVA